MMSILEIPIGLQQSCNQVTSIDPLTHWLRPSYLDDDPHVTQINFLNYRATLFYTPIF